MRAYYRITLALTLLMGLLFVAFDIAAHGAGDREEPVEEPHVAETLAPAPAPEMAAASPINY